MSGIDFPACSKRLAAGSRQPGLLDTSAWAPVVKMCRVFRAPSSAAVSGSTGRMQRGFRHRLWAFVG